MLPLIYTMKNKLTENVISTFMYSHGITNTWLAEQFGVTPQAIGERLRKTDMETSFVRRCSEFLKHNFFDDLAKTVNLPKSETKQNKVIEYPMPEHLAGYIETTVNEKLEKYIAKRNLQDAGSDKRKKK